jgi:hypothetical protein
MSAEYRVTISVGITVRSLDGSDAVSTAYEILDNLLSVLPDVHDVQLGEASCHKMPEETSDDDMRRMQQ